MTVIKKEKKGLSKRLEMSLEKKAEILDQEVAKEREEDNDFIKYYLEVEAARNGIRGGKEALKRKIMKVKNKTEKKRFAKYKKMSAEKLAEMKAKRESR